MGAADVLALAFALETSVGSEDEGAVVIDFVVEGVEADAGALEFEHAVPDMPEGLFVFVVRMVADGLDTGFDGVEAVAVVLEKFQQEVPGEVLAIDAKGYDLPGVAKVKCPEMNFNRGFHFYVNFWGLGLGTKIRRRGWC